MYKNIIVAVDGSSISDNAAKHAIELAKKHGAKLIAVTVSEPYENAAFGRLTMVDPAQYRRLCNEQAADIKARMTKSAETSGVYCVVEHIDNKQPYAGIIETAEQSGADLIVMGSHGKRGIEALLLGSQTAKLLTHTKIPTLVIR